MITFEPDDSLKTIVDLMFEHKTRKLLLEYSDQYISDRLILKEISKLLKFKTQGGWVLEGVEEDAVVLCEHPQLAPKFDLCYIIFFGFYFRFCGFFQICV